MDNFGNENQYEKNISSSDNQSTNIFIKLGILLGVILIAAVFIGFVYYLLQETTPTSTIRDILIIFMGFELSIIGFVAILLIIQIARLLNLIQNEVKPLLEAANETMGTLRGTAIFLGDTLVQPVIKANSFFAGFRRILDLLNLKRYTE
ncbi:MAG: hypothetical protein PVF83_17060 [Anaerolineales bacterium]|jgi:hypothetical protein